MSNEAETKAVILGAVGRAIADSILGAVAAVDETAVAAFLKKWQGKPIRKEQTHMSALSIIREKLSTATATAGQLAKDLAADPGRFVDLAPQYTAAAGEVAFLRAALKPAAEQDGRELLEALKRKHDEAVARHAQLIEEYNALAPQVDANAREIDKAIYRPRRSPQPSPAQDVVETKKLLEPLHVQRQVLTPEVRRIEHEITLANAEVSRALSDAFQIFEVPPGQRTCFFGSLGPYGAAAVARYVARELAKQ